MRTLEIFAGTQSFSKAVKRHSESHETVTVDILKNFNPTIKCDIEKWDYKVYPPGYFNVVWCSPRCTHYSKAKTCGIRNLEEADRLVRKSLEIIDYFKPKCFIIENVGTGLLVERMKLIRDIPVQFVDYCPYGKPYRKRTAIWSNVSFDFKLCPGIGKCLSMIERKHKGSCGNTRAEYNQIGARVTLWQKNSIPELLVDGMVFKCFAQDSV